MRARGLVLQRSRKPIIAAPIPPSLRTGATTASALTTIRQTSGRSTARRAAARGAALLFLRSRARLIPGNHQTRCFRLRSLLDAGRARRNNGRDPLPAAPPPERGSAPPPLCTPPWSARPERDRRYPA